MNRLQPSTSSQGTFEPSFLPPIKTGTVNKAWAKPVSFPDWRTSLDLEPSETDQKARFVRAIIAFLEYCKATRKPASIFNAKGYLEAGLEQGKCGQVDKEALRWFFVAHRREYGDQAATYKFAVRLARAGGMPAENSNVTLESGRMVL